jgi:hypothetical protein
MDIEGTWHGEYDWQPSGGRRREDLVVKQLGPRIWGTGVGDKGRSYEFEGLLKTGNTADGHHWNSESGLFGTFVLRFSQESDNASGVWNGTGDTELYRGSWTWWQGDQRPAPRPLGILPLVRSYTRDVELPLNSWKGMLFESIRTVGSGDHARPIHVAKPAARNDEGASHAQRTCVLITGGVHGDEPAGTLAIMHVGNSLIQEYRSLELYFIPCCNPTGYEINNHESYEQVDVNRSFGEGRIGCTESHCIMEWIESLGVRFHATIDLHEIDCRWIGEGFSGKDNPTQCYLYESLPQNAAFGEAIGHRVLASLQSPQDICMWPRIYDDDAKNGLVLYPFGMKNKVYSEGLTLDAYLLRRHTSRAFVTETPTVWDLQKRIDFQIRFLRGILNQLG